MFSLSLKSFIGNSLKPYAAVVQTQQPMISTDSLPTESFRHLVECRERATNTLQRSILSLCNPWRIQMWATWAGYRRGKNAVTVPQLLIHSLFWNHNTCDHKNCSCFECPPAAGLHLGAANTVVYCTRFKNEFKKINCHANIREKTHTDVPEMIPQ